MARRRSSKGACTKTTKPRGVDRRDAKIKKWEKASDIPLDEEDQFHSSKDRVLLDSDAEIDEGDEDEVFGLKGLDETDEESEEGGSGGEVSEEKEDVETPTAKKKRRAKSNKTKSAEKSSEDEEIDSEEEETWGRSKAAYFASRDDQLDSEDEEANELNEAEARRLQAKSRDGMVEADFGLEDLVISERVEGNTEVSAESTLQTLPSQQDEKSLIRHLEKTNPEALALARDWEDTALGLVRLQEKIAEIDPENSDAHITGILHLHYQTLLTYATTLAFYLHLRASEKYAQRPELLSSHPVMSRLLTLKHALASLEEIEPTLSDEEDESDEEDLDEDLMDVPSNDMNWRQLKRKGLEDGELNELIRDAGLASTHLPPQPSIAADDKQRPKKKLKLSSDPKRTAPSAKFDLTEPVFQSSISTMPSFDNFEVFGDATALERTDAAEKSSRKKSLRFHTSKIESTRKRRLEARNNAAGGDDDLPYRERKKEREKRTDREAKSKGRGVGGGGDDLDDVEPSPRINAMAHSNGFSADSDSDSVNYADEYYEFIKRRSRDKKEKKKAEYERAKAEERSEIETNDSASGPRSLTRAMLANKGLTPRRSKSVRNPRVKKREQFEKAKKKVSSQKAVYKGGIGDVHKYEGEKTGITKVVKSTKLA